MKTKVFALLLAVAMVLALAACGNGGEGGDATGPKDTLTVAVSAEPRSLDPFGSNDASSSDIKTQMYDTLLYVNSDASISLIQLALERYKKEKRMTGKLVLSTKDTLDTVSYTHLDVYKRQA